MNTYKEKVLRYRVLRHTEYSDSIKAEMRINGIEPDDCWALIWSFETEGEAELEASEERKYYPEPTYTIKVVDNGSESFIERPIY